MEKKIQQLLTDVENYTAKDRQSIENFRLQYISRKGVIGELFEELKRLSSEEKRMPVRFLISLNRLLKRSSRNSLNPWRRQRKQMPQ